MLIVSLYFYRDWYVPRAQLAKIHSRCFKDVRRISPGCTHDLKNKLFSYTKTSNRPFLSALSMKWKNPSSKMPSFTKEIVRDWRKCLRHNPRQCLHSHNTRAQEDSWPPRSIFGNCQSLLFQLTLWVSEQLLGPTAFEPDQEVQVEDLENHLLLSLTTGSTDYSLLATLARPWILKGRRISMIWYPDLWHALQRQQPFAAS